MRTVLISLLLATAIAAQTGDLPGMPPLLDKNDVYAGARVGNISAVIKSFPDRIYVRTAASGSVDVIDPHVLRSSVAVSPERSTSCPHTI
jgi:hypothetical protein